MEIKYWGSGSPLTWITIDSSNVLTYDAAKPGLDFSNGAADRYLYVDAAGETIPMAFNRGDYLAAGSQGVLLLHHHNTKGTRDQVIRIIDSASGTAGAIRGALDAPANDSTLSGMVDVLGWSAVVSGTAAGPAARVELFVDGVFGTRLAVGASRPDAAQYLAGQGITGPSNLGFKGQWNSQSVYDGAHLLTFRATDASDTLQETWSEIARITVRTANGITPTTRPPTTSSTTSTTITATTTTISATSTTLPSFAYRRYFPRMINDSTQATSLAVVNLSSSPASLNFKAYSNAGSLLASSQRVLPPLNPFAQLVSEIFPSLGDMSGWLLMESNAPSVEGFFLFFDLNLTVMDGAGVSGSPSRDFALPAGDEGELTLANPSNSAAKSTLEYFPDTGRSPYLAPLSVTVPAMGRMSLPLNSLRPPWARGGYLRVQGDGVVPMEVFGKPGWIAVLSGLDLAAPTTTSAPATTSLYAPQYAAGAGYATVLDIVNLENWKMPITLRLFGDNGAQIGTTGSITMPPLGSVRIENSSVFGVAAGSSLLQGYVKIEKTDPRVDGRFNGWVRFTDEAEAKFGTALQLVETGTTSTFFSQVAQNELFFTGLAALNPNPLTTTVTITVFNINGTPVATGRRDIPPGGRFSKLLPELVGSFPSMTKGYFSMTSTLPVAGFALFGTWSGEVLAAIPPQSPSGK